MTSNLIDAVKSQSVKHWYSEAESKRFAMNVSRVVAGGRSSESSILGTIAEQIAGGFDVVVVRYPASMVTLAESMSRAPDWRAFQADTLLLFSRRLPDELSGPGGWYSCTEADEGVGRLIAGTFDAYTSHYAANPALSPSAVREGYVEWALSFTTIGDGALLVRQQDDGVPVAFVAVKAADPFVDVELAGVGPRYRGKGFYTQALDAAESWGMSNGLRFAATATQVTNTPVINELHRRGFTQRTAMCTMHVLPLR